MNKYQDILSMISLVLRLYLKVDEETIKNTYEMKTLQELAEKATPKKVVEKTVTDFFDNSSGFCQTFEYKKMICPNPKCEELLLDEYEEVDLEGRDYCPNCGQALDWSEEE